MDFDLKKRFLGLNRYLSGRPVNTIPKRSSSEGQSNDHRTFVDDAVKRTKHTPGPGE
jgi:hypothetical protein